jgi:hypothetical protein
MKYKVVGILLVIFGLIQAAVPVVQILFIIPKLNTLIEQSSFASNYTVYSYVFSGLLVIAALLNLYLGRSMFSNIKEKYYRFGLISLIITFIFTGIIFTLMVGSTINIIYSISYQLQ